MIKDDNFYIVFHWMIKDLGLSGAELPIFAIIYSFSQDGKSYFNGSLNYLADFAGITRQGVIKVLKKLILEKNIVIKEQATVNGVKCNRYKVNLETISKFDGSQQSLPPVNRVVEGSKQSLHPPVNRVAEGSKQSLHNNKEIIKSNNKKDNKTTSTEVRSKFDWSEYTSNELTQIYPLNPEFGLTTAEIDLLYKVVDNSALERYLLKIQEYSTQDSFASIIRWAKQDMNFLGQATNSDLQLQTP